MDGGCQSIAGYHAHTQLRYILTTKHNLLYLGQDTYWNFLGSWEESGRNLRRHDEDMQRGFSHR